MGRTEIRVLKHPKTLVEIFGHERPQPGQTLAAIWSLEDEPGRACGFPRCGKYVDPLVIHIVMEGRPYHFECWHAMYTRLPDGTLQIKMF